MFVKNLPIVLIFLIGSTITPLVAQKMSPENIVQKQLEAYNERDIEAFMAVIDEEVTFRDFATHKTTISGYEKCKIYYEALFKASPDLKSTIVNRTVFDNKVIDHEHITGRNGKKVSTELVLIYEVANEKIVRVTVLSQSP